MSTSQIPTTRPGDMPPLPSARAIAAARAIEADEQSQDGHEPWTPAYREHVARLIDRAFDPKGFPAKVDRVFDWMAVEYGTPF